MLISSHPYIQVTDLAGTVSMLYGMLLHQDTPMRDEKSVPPKLPPHTTAVAQTTSQLLYRVVSRAFDQCDSCVLLA